MQYNYLPAAGLKVSRVCLGAMMFGAKIKEQNEADRIVAYALSQGVNFFDTADMYADGQSEIMLGRALDKRRDKAVVASKVGFPCMEKQEYSLSRGSILSGIEGTLRRLRTDYLDIYYLHQPDPNTPLAESLEALNDLVRAGKIRYIGMSNYAAWQMMDALALCAKQGWSCPVIAENCYNLLTRGMEDECVSFLKEKKLGLVNFNPLAGGLLTGKYKREGPQQGTRFFGNANYQKRYWREDNFSALDAAADLAKDNGLSLLELAYGWCLAQSHITSVLVGFSGEAQFTSNLEALQKGPIAPDLLPACDEIWEMLRGGRVSYNR